MTARVSAQRRTTKRGPPRTWRLLDAPVGEHDVEPARQRTNDERSLDDHHREIESALSQIGERAQMLTILDDQIIDHQTILDDPATDAWDRLDAERARDSLIDRHADLSRDVFMLAGDVALHGLFLGEWSPGELDAIGRQLTTEGGILSRVRAIWPDADRHPTWSTLRRESCPF